MDLPVRASLGDALLSRIASSSHSCGPACYRIILEFPTSRWTPSRPPRIPSTGNGSGAGGGDCSDGSVQSHLFVEHPLLLVHVNGVVRTTVAAATVSVHSDSRNGRCAKHRAAATVISASFSTEFSILIRENASIFVGTCSRIRDRLGISSQGERKWLRSSATPSSGPSGLRECLRNSFASTRTITPGPPRPMKANDIIDSQLPRGFNTSAIEYSPIASAHNRHNSGLLNIPWKSAPQIAANWWLSRKCSVQVCPV